LLQQSDTPLFTQLLRHLANQPLPFHIPGHKQGKGVDPEFYQYLGQPPFSLDQINIEPLDDLHHPEHVIKQAQELAAAAFCAEQTFFSVQGTTSAIQAMILSSCQPGDTLLLPRNIHQSVLSAMILADVTPVFLYPEIDPHLGIAHAITPAQVQAALDQHPESRALFLIHPTYYGTASDLPSIVQIAHARQIPVLVDEAHGALNAFHEKLPPSAMEVGADLAATSMHKLGGSLTQSSLLNLQGNLIDPQQVQSRLNLLMTTSTSYLLLASLDTQRRYLALHGHEAITRLLQLAQEARQKIDQIPGLSCFAPSTLPQGSIAAWDPSKLLIRVEELSITGHDAEQWLRESHHLEVELSDLHHFLCLITLGDDEESIDHLVTALKDLADTFFDPKQKGLGTQAIPVYPELALTPRAAYFHRSVVNKPLTQASGHVIAEPIIVYPPGIPLLLPGERITSDIVDYIGQHLAAGLPVKGTHDPQVETVRVIA
jgi:arginine/lysine/ornithine decarboxylase